MIRTPEGGVVDTLLSRLFLEAISHQVDTSVIKPCKSAKCRVTKKEWQAIPEPFVLLTIDTDAFDAVGGMTFIRKKIAQLVKIAKSEASIQLDLVAELLLYQLGQRAILFDWRDEDGGFHSFDEPIDWPGKQELVESLLIDEECEEDRYINEDTRTEFESFYSLMMDYDDVFWDLDFMLLSGGIERGICQMYVTLEYDREWHMRPWLDIGAPVPEIVVSVLDTVERHATEYGGMEEMRQALIKAVHEQQREQYDEEEEGEISRDAVKRKESPLTEDNISEIIGSAEAIKVIIDDTVEELSLKEQHRQQAIYVLAEHIISCATSSDSI